MLLSLYQIFIFLLGHLHFFLHFFFTFMENLFKKHPILALVCIHNHAPTGIGIFLFDSSADFSLVTAHCHARFFCPLLLNTITSFFVLFNYHFFFHWFGCILLWIQRRSPVVAKVLRRILCFLYLALSRSCDEQISLDNLQKPPKVHFLS